MKDKQAFIYAMDLRQGTNGHWYVNGNVEGHVKGDVKGGVLGSVKGPLWGKINGREWKFVDENNDE